VERISQTEHYRNQQQQQNMKTQILLSTTAALLAAFTLSASAADPSPAIFSAAATGTSVEGVVKDPTGRPIKAADVRIEAKNLSKIVRTDARGHYICDGLGVGTYKVTLVVNGQVKASILDAKTQAGKATQLNFDLTRKMVSTKKNTHMVYFPPSRETRMGGRWVEVDENGNIVGTTGPGASNVETIRGAAVQEWILHQRIQSANTQ
jgi:Carboxypeptidase regulatory-like domain